MEFLNYPEMRTGMHINGMTALSCSTTHAVMLSFQNLMVNGITLIIAGSTWTTLATGVGFDGLSFESLSGVGIAAGGLIAVWRAWAEDRKDSKAYRDKHLEVMTKFSDTQERIVNELTKRNDK